MLPSLSGIGAAMVKATRDKKTIKDEEKRILSEQNLKAEYFSKALIILWYEMPSLQDPFVIHRVNIRRHDVVVNVNKCH